MSSIKVKFSFWLIYYCSVLFIFFLGLVIIDFSIPIIASKGAISSQIKSDIGYRNRSNSEFKKFIDYHFYGEYPLKINIEKVGTFKNNLMNFKKV